MDNIQKQKLKKFVRSLERIRGRHTELVSVYVPSGYDITKIIQHLQQEQGTATNIKSSGTRDNVIDALESIPRITEVQDITVNFNNPDDILIVVKVFVVEAGS